jgi:hypothetical protein
MKCRHCTRQALPGWKLCRTCLWRFLDVCSVVAVSGVIIFCIAYSIYRHVYP